MEIRTSDLYCASYIFAKGGELKEVELLDGEGRQRAEFVLVGEDVHRLERLFQSGRAMVDLKTFKTSLNHLKDVMFQKIRNR